MKSNKANDDSEDVAMNTSTTTTNTSGSEFENLMQRCDAVSAKGRGDYATLLKAVGPGAMRFALTYERSIAEQIASLTPAEKACWENLKARWNKNLHPDMPISDELCLRFARCSPGPEKFNEKRALKVMKSFDLRYLTLSAANLEHQLLTKTLFPVPGLKSNEAEGGHDIFYMRPGRYFPRKTPVPDIIDNLAYCMNCMVEKEKACAEGIGFLAYMEDWHMNNFSIQYCYQFMMMLQGKIPVRVRLFLIVNPPGWFGKIWAIMKPMLAADFRKKVKMISTAELKDYLAEGFEEFLPDDVQGYGKANTAQMVHDFVTYRKHVEAV